MKTSHTKNFPLPVAKFFRRPDLTPLIRLYIGVSVLMAQRDQVWGTVTALAREFVISRTFAYWLAYQVDQAGDALFGQMTWGRSGDPVWSDRGAYCAMVSLRLEGGCSLGAIATLMKRFGVRPSATGTISQTLQAMGGLLPKTLSPPDGQAQVLVVFASDEVFAHGVPILVTVEPVSSALLRIELVTQAQWAAWQQHWRCIEEAGYYALYVVSDEGQALCKAQQQTLADSVRQPDLYHAIAHRLGALVRRLEQEAYQAMEREEKQRRRLRLAKTAAKRQVVRALITYTTAQTAAKIDRYEDVRYLYHCLIEDCRLFDDTGHLRSRQAAEGNILAALALLEELDDSRIVEAAHSIRRTLPVLLHYLDQAQFIVAQLMTLPAPPEALQALCLAWQWHKNWLKAKTSQSRRYCRAQEQRALARAFRALPEDGTTLQARVYRQLNQIVRSSSMVECLNSILRPYLDTTRNHITQELLNLIMFYHNHRRYLAGERKGHTPLELLTGTPQEADWLTLLFDEIERQKPDFFTTTRSRQGAGNTTSATLL